MKKLKLFLLLTAMSATVLSGCITGKKEVKNSGELLAKMQEASKSYDSAEMGISMVVTSEGDATTGGSFSMEMNGTSSVILKTETAKMEGTMKVNVAGQEQQSDMKIYSQKDADGKYTVYTYQESAGWYKMTSDTSDYDYSSMVDYKALAGLASVLDLSKETEKVENVECYKLTGTLTGEDIKSLYSSIESMGVSEDNLDDYTVDLTIYAEKDNFRTRSMKLALTSKEDAAAPMSLTMDITFKSFDSVKSIEIPEEAKAAQDVTSGN